MLSEHFNIYRVSYYLLHTIKNDVEIIRLAYSVSNFIKTNYFVDFEARHPFFLLQLEDQSPGH